MLGGVLVGHLRTALGHLYKLGLSWDIVESSCDFFVWRVSHGVSQNNPETSLYNVLGLPCKLWWLNVYRIPRDMSQSCCGASCDALQQSLILRQSLHNVFYLQHVASLVFPMCE